MGQLVLRGCRIVVPKKLRHRTLRLAHEGHLGIVKTKQRLREKIWWPEMDRDVEKVCKSCHPCRVLAAAGPMEPLNCTEMPIQPWDVLGIDIMGHNILVVVNYYSPYCEVLVKKTITAQVVIDELDRIFAVRK